MTGLYDGIGLAIFLSILSIIANPILTVLVVRETGLLNKYANVKRIVMYAIILLIVATMTVVVIRIFAYISLIWLLVYTAISGVVLITQRIKK